SAAQRPIGVAERVPRPGALNQARQQSRVRQGYLAEILSEIHLRALAESVNAEAALIAEINRVGVILENLLLGQLLLELHRDQSFRDFSAPAALRAQPQRARQLLADRGSSLQPPRIEDVPPGGPHDAHRIEARVGEEMLVFR